MSSEQTNASAVDIDNLHTTNTWICREISSHLLVRQICAVNSVKCQAVFKCLTKTNTGLNYSTVLFDFLYEKIQKCDFTPYRVDDDTSEVGQLCAQQAT